jgi:hypothetical protein
MDKVLGVLDTKKVSTCKVFALSKAMETGCGYQVANLHHLMTFCMCVDGALLDIVMKPG